MGSAPTVQGGLIAIVESARISNNQGKEVFGEMFTSGGKANPKIVTEIVKAKVLC